jgi:hypothetical protein
VRNDKLDPIEMKSITLTAEPMRPTDLTLKLLPKLTNSKAESADPTRA